MVTLQSSPGLTMRESESGISTNADSSDRSMQGSITLEEVHLCSSCVVIPGWVLSVYDEVHIVSNPI